MARSVLMVYLTATPSRLQLGTGICSLKPPRYKQSAELFRLRGGNVILSLKFVIFVIYLDSKRFYFSFSGSWSVKKEL